MRSIDVHEGEEVQAGQVLARLDPTFAAADLGALEAQVVEPAGARSRGCRRKPRTSRSPTRARSAIWRCRRRSTRSARPSTTTSSRTTAPEDRRACVSTIARASSDAAGYRDRLGVATERREDAAASSSSLQVGSKLNTLAAMDKRAEMQRDLRNAEQTAQARSATCGADRRARRLHAVLARRRVARSSPRRPASCRMPASS